MPPDADKLRQRKAVPSTPLDEDSTAATAERLCSLANLKTTEICIEGVIYDISDFEHPGGDSIQVFAGNDVTIQYKMIHAYHTSKHLDTMKRVGKVTDYETE